MPHITVEYSENIASKVAIGDLLRTLHDHVASQGIDAFKIKSRGVKLTDYIIGDEQAHTSMIHVNCLLLAGRPAPFASDLSKAFLAQVQVHIEKSSIKKCSPSVEVRNMDVDLYSQ